VSVVGKVGAVHTRPPVAPSRSALDRRPVVALGAWTVFLWITRIKNALGDAAMTDGGKAVALLTSALFLLAAAVVTAAVWRRVPGAGRAAAAFAVVSIVYWIVRAVTIVVRDHPLGFTLVHTALALITVGLAVLVLRARRRTHSGSSWAATAG
jgi:hypothetical protein